MTKPTPKRKPFRRKMWAVMCPTGRVILYPTKRWAEASEEAEMVRRLPYVLITELPRKGRDGK